MSKPFDAAAVNEDGGKEQMPKKVSCCVVFSGHALKKCMTVIGRWGAIVTRSFRRLIFAWAAFLSYD